MTLITSPASRREVGLHALIVGVGCYTHLDGGSGKKAPKFQGMGQLTSPYHSVMKFARWLESDFNLEDTPVASIRILTNPPDGQNKNIFSEPTFANIRDAAVEWLEDCGAHENNLALFYFCGHGVEVGTITALLAQDFAEVEAHPFFHSFDLDKLTDAALAYKARRQLFLIDACRTSSEAIFKEYGEGIDPSSLIQVKRHKNLGPTKQSVIRASDVAADAYGRPGKSTVFMSALLESMKGAGAQPHPMEEDAYVVSTTTLKIGINWLVRIESPDGAPVQEVVSGRPASDFPFHQLTANPIVPVAVRVKPMNGIGNLNLSTDCGQHRAPQPTPWYVNVESGPRVFYAGYDDEPQKYSKAKEIYPQYQTVYIPCGEKS